MGHKSRGRTFVHKSRFLICDGRAIIFDVTSAMMNSLVLILVSIEEKTKVIHWYENKHRGLIYPGDCKATCLLDVPIN